MDGDKGNRKKGFAGLDSMVSDAEVPKAPAPEPVRRDEKVAEPEPVSPRPQPAYTGNTSPSGSSGKWWAIGIGLVAFFIWIGSLDKHTTPEAAPAPAPEAAAPAPAWENVAPAPAPYALAPAPAPEAVAPAPAPIYEPVSPSTSGDEEMPPVGSGLVFNRSQIRYCLSEKIRISAWQGQVDQYSETSVNAFNEAVNDYNRRCSHFRYRSGAVESVQSEIDAIRHVLRSQGFARAEANP